MFAISLLVLCQTLSVLASKWHNVSISSEQYDQLSSIVHFAKVSTCMNDTEFDTGTFESLCPLNSWCEENPEIEVLESVRPPSDNESGTAYVAADHANSMVYVVFRGSTTAGDWNTDYTFTLCDFAPVYNSTLKEADLNITMKNSYLNEQIKKHGNTDLCENCKVHCGLMIGYTQFMDTIYDAASPYLEQGYNLTVTGHSLGGGYAIFAGLDFKLRGYDPLVITYAALKQGNQAFNSFVDFMFNTIGLSKSIAEGDAIPFGAYARVYNPWDLIPMLPPTANFTNGGLEFELMTLDVPQNLSDVKFQGPSDNFKPDNTSYVMSLFQNATYDRWAYHSAYFTNMSAPCDDLK
ncbi:CYFA0S13e01024g1_1 [Cyberlindnera fabianii]|uniref:triacylglycerol lipase n=1 Tax=Cyberlindnera fabianii TaxID=36022 RepID=A0A061B3D2_CYBFA|nr:CYFA0S13e01024g1_1 [Cyberlindnera fabianii]